MATNRRKGGLGKSLNSLLAGTLGETKEPSKVTTSKAGASKSKKKATKKVAAKKKVVKKIVKKKVATKVKKKATPPETVETSHSSSDLVLTSKKESVQTNLVQELPVLNLQPGRYQPRKDVEQAELEPLADSIKTQGLLQPIVVRAVKKDKYEIIAGERRWRAAQLAGLEQVPVLIKSVSDEAAMVIALVENMQREDLSPMEEAMGLERLCSEFGLTHAEVAEGVGKSRTQVSNLLRLLSLNDDVKQLLERGEIDFGHAKVLLATKGPRQSQLARLVVSKQLSVRELEATIAKLSHGGEDKTRAPIDPDIRRLQNSLSDTLGAKVNILHSPKGRGKLVIHYASLDELEGVLSHIESPVSL